MADHKSEAPQRAGRIDLEQFFEVASAASLRALASHVELNPQPLPPRFLPHIWVGIVASLALPEAPQLQGGVGQKGAIASRGGASAKG